MAKRKSVKHQPVRKKTDSETSSLNTTMDHDEDDEDMVYMDTVPVITETTASMDTTEKENNIVRRRLNRKSTQPDNNEKRSTCTHVKDIAQLSSEIINKANESDCIDCSSAIRAQWLCLHSDCLAPLCGTKEGLGHFNIHHSDNLLHCIFLNLKKSRMYCRLCESEVWENNDPPISSQNRQVLSMKRSRRFSSNSHQSTVLSVVPKDTIKTHPSHTPPKSRGEPIERFAVQSRPIVRDMEDAFEDSFPKGLTGLINLGNTCYFNAAIQALSNCAPFADYFLSKGDLRPFAVREPLVSNSFSQLIHKLWSPQREPVVNPRALISGIRDNFIQFRGWNQQDAQELIRCLLELLHRELGQPVYPYQNYTSKSLYRPRRHSSTSSCDSDIMDVETAGDSGLSSDCETPGTSTDSRDDRSRHNAKKPLVATCLRSIVTDVFDGSIESSVKCLTCMSVSTKTETFQDLSLPIPSREQIERIKAMNALDGCNYEDGIAPEEQSMWSWWSWLGWISSAFGGPTVSLEDCLSAFFSPDRLDGDDMYACSKCRVLRNGVKTSRVCRLPEVLCVHVKRFRHDAFNSSKVSTRVTFPLVDLDMRPFASESESHNALYELCSFVTHEGGGADSGHYIAYCRNQIDGNWYEFDDGTVTKLDCAYVLTKEAYVLFYQKKSNIEAENLRAQIHEKLAPQHVVRSSDHRYISSEWLLKLDTFSHPGPITNYDFLCRHGHLLPRRSKHIGSICTPVTVETWKLLLKKFGGGPSVSALHHCLVCNKKWKEMEEKRSLEKRKSREIEAIVRELQYLHEEATYGYHLPWNIIDSTWFNQWQQFLTDECAEAPGPIDNCNLLVQNAEGTTRLKTSVSGRKIQRELYLYLQQIYGGGPEVFYHEKGVFSDEELSEVDRLVFAARKIFEENERKRQVASNI